MKDKPLGQDLEARLDGENAQEVGLSGFLKLNEKWGSSLFVYKSNTYIFKLSNLYFHQTNHVFQ